METDRPGQTESTSIVPAGWFQAELGGVFTNADSETQDTETISILPALVRVGVLRSLEARVGFAGWVHTETSSDSESESTSGLGSVGLGLKYRIKQGTGFNPAVALLATAFFPVGKAGIRTARVDPAIRVALSHQLSDRTVLGYNVGYTAVSAKEAAGDVTTTSIGVYNLSLGYALASRVGAFAEAFGLVGLSDGTGSSHLIDAGLTFLALRNLQFDVSGGLRYAGEGDDWFLSGGVSFRLPH
jgi:hypothetical protein